MPLAWAVAFLPSGQTSAWQSRQTPDPGPACASNPRPREWLASSSGLSVGELASRAPAALASVDPSLQDLAGTRGRAAGGALLDSSCQIQQLPLTLRGHCKGTSVCQAVRDPPGQQLKHAAHQYPSCRPLRMPRGSVGATTLQEDFPGVKGEVEAFLQRVWAMSTPRGAGPQGFGHSCHWSRVTVLPSYPGPQGPQPQENVTPS